jgi:hypothetical protein
MDGAEQSGPSPVTSIAGGPAHYKRYAVLSSGPLLASKKSRKNPLLTRLAMGFKIGRNDHDFVGFTTLLCQFDHDATKNAHAASADEAVINCLVMVVA